MKEIENFITSVSEYKIPESFPQNFDILDYFSNDPNFFYIDPKRIVNKYGMWCIVSKDWVKNLAEQIKGKRVLEIMAGAGWLSKALSEFDIDIIATDDKSWENGNKSHNNKFFKEVFNVEKIDALKSIFKYREEVDILLVSWPPYSDGKELADALFYWDHKKPIIYIGENNGGCNSGDLFWNNFLVDENICIENPSWFGIYDNVYFGYWKK